MLINTGSSSELISGLVRRLKSAEDKLERYEIRLERHADEIRDLQTELVRVQGSFSVEDQVNRAIANRGSKEFWSVILLVLTIIVGAIGLALMDGCSRIPIVSEYGSAPTIEDTIVPDTTHE